MIEPVIIGDAFLYKADCRDVLALLPDNSIDSIVTDPPYELGFMGKSWDSSGIAYDVGMWAEAMRVLKPGGHLLAFSGARTYHRMAVAIEDAGFEVRDQILWIYGQGFPKSHNLEGEMEGWGTGLKPAHEPICMARKPLIGTVAQNVEEHGTGAINIAACRIQTDDTLRAGSGGIPCRHDEKSSRKGEASANRTYESSGGTDFSMKPGPRGGGDLGRWPANVIHDGSDEVIALFPITESGKPTGIKAGGQGNAFGKYAGGIPVTGFGDVGSAARFFYCSKADRVDRNEGIEHMQAKSLNWSSGDKNPGSFQSDNTDRTSPNYHPTVKPVDLMRYLWRLVTPVGGTGLDLFMGSGSGGKAAILEGFKYIGIEKDVDEKGSPLGYFEISVGRIRMRFPSPSSKDYSHEPQDAPRRRARKAQDKPFSPDVHDQIPRRV